MNFFIKNMKWAMLVSGILTSTMFYGLFAPQVVLESMFGYSFVGSVEEIIIRSWSALVGLIGVMLIYGFFSEKNRVFSISIAAISKVVFVSLVLLHGQDFLDKTELPIIMDIAVIILSGFYLVAMYTRKISLVIE